MTKEEKQLLLIDLCARLPYGVKVGIRDCDYPSVVQAVYSNLDVLVNDICRYSLLEECFIYLRPMSSMTPQEWIELCDAGVEDEKSAIFINGIRRFVPHTNRENFLNSKHFDHHNLIPLGLALEAPEGMYK